MNYIRSSSLKVLLFLVLGLWCMSVFILFDTYFAAHTYLVSYQFTAECPVGPDSTASLPGTDCSYTGSIPVSIRLRDKEDTFYSELQVLILSDLTSKNYKVVLRPGLGIVLLNIVKIR